jgi:hypothetical protein
LILQSTSVLLCGKPAPASLLRKHTGDFGATRSAPVEAHGLRLCVQRRVSRRGRPRERAWRVLKPALASGPALRADWPWWLHGGIARRRGGPGVCGAASCERVAEQARSAVTIARTAAISRSRCSPNQRSPASLSTVEIPPLARSAGQGKRGAQQAPASRFRTRAVAACPLRPARIDGYRGSRLLPMQLDTLLRAGDIGSCALLLSRDCDTLSGRGLVTVDALSGGAVRGFVG